MRKPLRIGLVGCGAFGQFCLDTFSRMEEVELTTVMDLDANVAKKTASAYHCAWFTDYSEFLKQTNIDLVHLVTPPSSHYSMSMEALRAGKHILCEKPLALKVEQGEEMIHYARERNLLLPVNFVLRHVPVTDRVKEIIASGVLGSPLRAYFENYATDHNLDSTHWFWNKKISGGIYIEHGVHFFDLYRYWFGNAEILLAHTETRPHTGQEDRVFCMFRHENGVLSGHYHGFDQPAELDRQIHRLVFEKGDMIVRGWIPESISVHALVNDGERRMLEEIMKQPCEIMRQFPDGMRIHRGRGNDFAASCEIKSEFAEQTDKQSLYRNAITQLVRDQIRKIYAPKHQRIISEENGLLALKMAVRAADIASIS